MYTISIICSLLSVVCLYAAAKRVEFEKKGFMLWLASHVEISRVMSATLFILSVFALTIDIGLVISILTAVCVWMLLASLIVLFAPFYKSN